jgi:hypothetical protein
MTLVAYNRFSDGRLLISDRKGTRPWGNHEEVKKMFVSDSKQFVFSGGGIGFDATYIATTLCRDGTVTGANIQEKLSTLLRNYFIAGRTYHNPESWLVAYLLVRGGNGLFCLELVIEGDTFTITPVPTTHRCCGVEAAKVLGDYFFKRRKLDELSWDEATRYAIATFREVAKEVDAVGKPEDFGLDIAVLMDNGEVYEAENFKDSSCTLSVDLKVEGSITAGFQQTQAARGGN